MVNHYANTTSLLLSNTRLLELSESEATALAEFSVVADGLATDGGSQESEWANTERGGLSLAGIATAELAAGLIEPSANSALPVLAEMVGVKDYAP